MLDKNPRTLLDLLDEHGIYATLVITYVNHKPMFTVDINGAVVLDVPPVEFVPYQIKLLPEVAVADNETPASFIQRFLAEATGDEGIVFITNVLMNQIRMNFI